MTKQVVWLSDEDLPKWDRFVENHPLGGLCQMSVWKRIMEDSFPQIRGRFCAVVDSESGEIFAGIPVYTVNSWLLGNRLVSVPFATLTDPLVSSADELNLLVAKVVELADIRGARYTEIRSLRAAQHFNQSGMRASHSFVHHFTRLDRSPEEIWSTLGRTAVRQMISKAERMNIELVKVDDWHQVEAFHRLLCQTRRRLAVPPIPLRFYRSLWRELMHSGHLTLLLAVYQGKTAGGVLCLKWRDTFALEYAGDNGQLRKSGIVQYLYWEAMKQAIEEGREIFSFGRTYRGNQGLMRSKSHWGTEMQDLCTFFYPLTTHKDAEDREASVQFRTIKWLSSRLPDSAYRLLGEFCYRHMG